ncbi:unnamed protein product [Spirodela intermedia]|uniref:Uncharacterized protein n=2 Tax=Spirodela intermedia TaxID=51605 RepID=A0A7I8LHQ9_SPIIN|nr:unnamed protein product [Spirodela intermedia]CAA6672399.1 unnamed protein product [Spirodela intermedia]CAA7409583.1 unnamed protein product [Spirodela intermedia]
MKMENGTEPSEVRVFLQSLFYLNYLLSRD